MMPWPSKNVMAGKAKPSWVSRNIVQVVLLVITSISPDCKAGKRVSVVSATIVILFGSPSTRA